MVGVARLEPARSYDARLQTEMASIYPPTPRYNKLFILSQIFIPVIRSNKKEKMNTIEIKLNEPVSINFICPKGDVFKMAVSCDGVVVTPPTPPTPPVTPPVNPPSSESDVAKKAASDVKAVVDIMVDKDPTSLRTIGTAYYTLQLNNTYTVEASTTALTKLLGYLPAAFIVVFNNAPDADKPEVCAGIVNAIQTALTGKGLPGIY